MQKLKILTAFNLFEILVYTFVFAVTGVIFFGALYALINILMIEYSLASFVGIFILAIIMFSCYGGMRVFVVTVNHLYYELRREVLYDSIANRLVLGKTTLDLNDKDFIVIQYAPRYLLVNTEMKYRLKTYSKFELKVNNKSYFISSILELPEELAKTVHRKTKHKILKRHVWMTA